MPRLLPYRLLAPVVFLSVVIGDQLAAAEDSGPAGGSSPGGQPEQVAEESGGSGGAGIDFVRDIRPILSENCFFCHGPDENQRQAGLRLDVESSAQGVIEPGDAAASELMSRLVSDDPSMRMPPPDSNRELTSDQIELVRRWIDGGAGWEKHWSFRPIQRPAVPRVNGTATAPIQNPIDAFVQHRLQQEDLEPSPQADRRTLIRRLSLDLTGLPPKPADVDAFVHSDDPLAYEKLVDRLLDSPAYGERMAWQWLDAARYADTNGYQGDRERTMWPWRDWVIDAFNDNLPFDQFTVWQLAGDLLPDATHQQRLATGFSRNHMINGEGGRIAEENRVEYVMDMTETVGTVWLGMTLNCCRCHDHKYDPLTNREYYRFTAFFNQTPVTGAGGDPQTEPNLAAPTAAQQKQLARLNQQLNALDEQEQTPETDHDADAANQKLDTRRESLVQQKQKLQNQIPRVMVMRDMEDRRPTYMLERGLYNKRGAEVEAGVPKVFPSLKQAARGSASDDPADRLDLARWLVSDDNPLTARVTVNRFWQQIFGIGLVKTVEDFGAQGEIPPHMDLLNWLSAEFRGSGWNVKRLMRLIVTSHTYRQSSKVVDAELQQRDPDNRLMARGSRYRMPSWMIRDAALAAAGLITPVQGGPGVNTYQPAGVWAEATFGKKNYQRDDGQALYRRSLYIFWRRIIAPTIFFDNASRQTCTVNDSRTNTPLHALRTLNDVTFVEAARVMAGNALTAGDENDSAILRRIFVRVLARPPKESEQRIMLSRLDQTRDRFGERPDQARELLGVGESARRESLDAVEHASWTALGLAVLNLDEALNRE